MIDAAGRKTIHALVRRELESQGFSVSEWTGEGRYHFEARRGDKSFPIIVRISTGDWPQADVDAFLDIERLEDGTEIIRGLKPEPIPGLTYVFVQRTAGRDDGHRFFPITWPELCQIDKEEHQRALNRSGQKRRQNRDTRETTIREKDLRRYQSRWDLIV
jgi:hypothetical protein